MKNITYRQLTLNDIPDDFLAQYSRYQETNQIIVYQEGQLSQRDLHYVDDWNADQLVEVAQELRECIQNGGFVLGAFQDETCIGFSCVEPGFWGSRSQYRELSMCQVSHEMRGKGIGRELFNRTRDVARSQGVEKFYISAHPAVETQGFYRSVGCVLAEEVNPEIVAREPYDIQLELTL